MYGTPLGQPILPQDVLQFTTSPQMSVEWGEWVNYWYQKMRAATTLQEIQAIRGEAVNDLINQGAVDELIANQPGVPYGFALGVLDGMANTAASGIGVYHAGTSSEEIYTPTAPINIPVDYYGTQVDPLEPPVISPEAIEHFKARLQQFEASLPNLQRYADQGQPGAAETLRVVLRDIASMRAMLASVGAQVLPPLTPYDDPHQGPAGSKERYILDGMIYEYEFGHGPPTSEEIADGIGVVGTTDTPDDGGSLVSFSPSPVLLAAGVALLFFAFPRRKRA